MKFLSSLSLAVLLAMPVLAAENEVIRADALSPETQGKTNVAGKDDDIQFFGHQSPVSAAKAVVPVPEAKQEIHRPEQTAVTSPVGATAESRTLDRRAANPTGWKFTEMLPLAAVLAIIAVVGLIIRRVMPARNGGANAAGLLEVVARTPISPKHNVMLVRVAKRFLLLGVSPESVNTLCILDDSQAAAELITEIASRRSDSSSHAFESSFDAESEEFEDQEEVPESAVRGLLSKVRKLKRSRVA